MTPIYDADGITVIGYTDDQGNQYDASGQPLNAPSGGAKPSVTEPSRPDDYTAPFKPPAGASPTGGGVHTVAIPGGGQVVTWSEPNPNYDPNGLPGASNQQFLTHTQYVTPQNSGSTTNNIHTSERLIDPNQIAVEQMRNQNQIDIAKLQNLAANARTEAERQHYTAEAQAKQQELSGQMGNGQQTLAGQKQGFDQFQQLAQLAANPRNFMQNFFEHRGFQPPANSQQYGTQQYATPGFLGGTPRNGGGPQSGGAGAGGVLAGSPATAPSLPGRTGMQTPQPASLLQNTPASPNYQQNLSSLSGQNPALAELLGNARSGSPTGQIGNQSIGIGGFEQSQRGNPADILSGTMGLNLAAANPQMGPDAWAGGDAITRPTNRPDANYNPGHIDPSTLAPAAVRALGNSVDLYAGAEGYAQGGVVPEPVMGVGMHSNPEVFQALQSAPGHKYLMGEKGPEGVVPASYLPKFLQSRQGQEAMGGEGGNGMPPGMPDPHANSVNFGQDQQVPWPYNPEPDISTWGNAATDGRAVPNTSFGPHLMPPPANGPDPRFAPPTLQAYGQGGPLGMPNRQMQNAMRTPLRGATMDGGGVGVGTDITAFADGGILGDDGSSEENPYGTDPNVQNGGQSPYAALTSSGALPPFLQRAMGQSQGNQAYGTNTAQKAYLPPGLPLESELGYSQMSPSEQQAYQSYASSYGIDPNDLLAQIRQQTAPGRMRQRTEFVGQ